jgi:hypothetical protein
MRLHLKRHPGSTCAAVSRIEAEAGRPRRDELALRYVVTGNISALRLPAAAPPMRADSLWRHSCFEAFVRASPDATYCEFNFSPARAWAAYRFDGYRSGMRIAGALAAPQFEIRTSDKAYEMHVQLALDGLPELCGDVPWRLGLSAVIEEAGGGMSYWALAHLPGKPDFHHVDGFAVELFAPPAKPASHLG